MSDMEEQTHAIARAKKEAEAEAHTRYQRSVEKARNLWFIIWTLIGASMAGAVWTTTMQLTVNGVRKEIEFIRSRQESIIAKVDTYIGTNSLAMQQLSNLTASAKAACEENHQDYKALAPKVHEMWWMKERGITNKDKEPPH